MIYFSVVNKLTCRIVYVFFAWCNHRDPNGLGVNEFEDFKAVKEAPNAASSSAAVPKATKPAKLADYVYFQRHESGTAYGV